MMNVDEIEEVENDPMVPELRARAVPSGIPFESQGETWLLRHGGLAPELDDFRDRIDDEARLNDSISLIDVFEAGRLMLMANYDLTSAETITIMVGADQKKLADATMEALFGTGEGRRTYSQWARTSLYCAGLNVEEIPPEMVPLVLENLVILKRAVPIDQFTDAARAAPQLKAARARAQAHAKKLAEQAAGQAPATLTIPAEAVIEAIQKAGASS
jgi:hypothetical protein